MIKKAIIIGAGKIGRGFIAQLLYEAGWSIAFFDISTQLVNQLNANKSYTTHILGDSTRNSTITNYEVFTLSNQEVFNQTWKNSALIFTAMGGKNIDAIAPVIANAIKNSFHDNSNNIKNIITCENWKEPAAKLHQSIANHLSDAENVFFDKTVGLSEAVIMRVSVEPSDEQRASLPIDTWCQDFWELPINRETFLGDYPDINHFNFIAHFGRFLEQKIFTNNSSNATIAYHGYHHGFIYTADATKDPLIARLLDQAIAEINQVVHLELGVPLAEQQLFAQKAKAKYSDPTIVDPLYRHAADPIRKLGPEDRLIAPARLALKYGITPKALVKTIVAAIFYDYPQDPIAVELSTMRVERGIDFILTSICKLYPDEELYSLVKQEIDDFVAKKKL